MRGAVEADGFGGDLNRHVRDGAAQFGQGLAVKPRVKHMTARRVAQMQVQPVGAGICAGARGRDDFG